MEIFGVIHGGEQDEFVDAAPALDLDCSPSGAVFRGLDIFDGDVGYVVDADMHFAFSRSVSVPML